MIVLKISILLVKVALPSDKINSTHLMDSSFEEKGAVKAASAEAKEIPISPFKLEIEILISFFHMKKCKLKINLQF